MTFTHGGQDVTVHVTRSGRAAIIPENCLR